MNRLTGDAVANPASDAAASPASDADLFGEVVAQLPRRVFCWSSVDS